MLYAVGAVTGDRVWCKMPHTRIRLGREEAIINIFEQNTYSVVNIFDVTLTVSGRP
jgi:hypothetical protein